MLGQCARQFLCSHVSSLHPSVKATDLKDVSAILQLNKPCVWFVFSAEEDLGDFSSVTNAALVGAILTTQTNALMIACFEQHRAWFIASTTIARFVAQPGTLLVWT